MMYCPPLVSCFNCNAIYLYLVRRGGEVNSSPFPLVIARKDRKQQEIELFALISFYDLLTIRQHAIPTEVKQSRNCGTIG